jgi:hypothetical protein
MANPVVATLSPQPACYRLPDNRANNNSAAHHNPTNYANDTTPACQG